jgi:hypothetical protein
MTNFEGKFALKETVRDSITGFEGIVTGATFWSNGCVRYSVQSKTMKDGKPIEPEWFDEQQLESVAAAPEQTIEKRGGPMPDPKRP